MNSAQKKENTKIYLWGILTIALALKIPFWTKPLVGYFSSYQTVNAMMAAMMADGQGLARFFIPKTFLLFGGEPSLHLLYYPFAALFANLGHSFLGMSLDFWGRAQASIWMLCSGWVLFLIAKRFFDEAVGLIAAAIFSFAPLCLLMGISFQNEAVGVFFLLASFWLYTRKASHEFWAGILFGLALVARIHFFVILPVFILYSFFEKEVWGKRILFLAGILIPVAVWHAWIYYLSGQYASQIMTSVFMQTGQDRFLLHPYVFQKEFYERIYELLTNDWIIPGVFGIALIGFWPVSKKHFLFTAWFVLCLTMVLVLPQKLHDHPFYMIPLMPALAILAAGVLEKIGQSFNRKAWVLFSLVLLGMSLRYYLPSAMSGREDALKLQQIAAFVKIHTSDDAIVAAEFGSTPDLLYYADRKGWPFYIPSHPSEIGKRALSYGGVYHTLLGPTQLLQDKIQHGAQYLVISHPGSLDLYPEFKAYLTNQFVEITADADSFRVYDLREVKS